MARRKDIVGPPKPNLPLTYSQYGVPGAPLEQPIPDNSIGFDPFAGLFGGTASAYQALQALPPAQPEQQHPLLQGIQGLVQRLAQRLRPRGMQGMQAIPRRFPLYPGG
jgi:hypothetical protein